MLSIFNRNAENIFYDTVPNQGIHQYERDKRFKEFSF